MESVIGRVLATLVTIIALAGLGYAAYNGFESNRISNFSAGVLSLTQAIDQTYATSPSTTGLYSMPAANLQQASSLWAANPPVGTIGATGAMVDPFGDSVEVFGHGDTGALVTTTTPAQYEVDVLATAMTPSDCQSLLSSLSTSLTGAVINGTAIAGQPTPTELAADCTGVTGKTVSLVFTH